MNRFLYERRNKPHQSLYCQTCHLACLPPTSTRADTELICPRCGEKLMFRIPESLSKTGAYLLAAAILYIPANLFPMTRITSLGQVETDTILSGVAYFMAEGLWFIAAVIFIASILVPLFKLVSLTGLLISIHRRSAWRPVERTRLFQLVERVGRWSMVDVFVITVMLALVQAGGLVSVEIGPGAIYFTLVVILTMRATHCFDPRLIWDAAEKDSP